jgi:hypothetical protein
VISIQSKNALAKCLGVFSWMHFMLEAKSDETHSDLQSAHPDGPITKEMDKKELKTYQSKKLISGPDRSWPQSLSPIRSFLPTFEFH